MYKPLLENKVKLHYKLPTNYNNGDQIPDQAIVDVKNFFINSYEGLSIDSTSEGYWKEDGFVYHDTNLEFSIFVPKAKFEREVKKEIPKHIEKFRQDFRQLAILCYYHDVVST